MNFDIKFDFQRRERLGLIEAIWGQDKSIDQLKRLSENVLGKNEVVFITRINREKAIDLLYLYEDARFYEEAKCLIIGRNLNKLNTKKIEKFGWKTKISLDEGIKKTGIWIIENNKKFISSDLFYKHKK